MRIRLFKYVVNVTRSTIFPTDLATSKKQFVLIYAVRLFFLVGRRLWKDRCPRQAAALAYQTFLSLVPLVFVALAITSFLDMERYVENVVLFIENNLLPDSAQTAARYVRDTALAIRPRPLGVFGGLGFVAIGMTLIFTVEQVINEIFRCRKGRRLVIRILLGVSLLAVVPVAFGASLYYSGKLLFIVSGATEMLLPMTFTTLALFLVYWLMPHTRIQKRHALTSALVAGVGLELAKWGFALYAGHLGGTLSYVYGTMAIIPLFLVWVYLIWLIFLFGAELNAALHEVKSYERFTA